MYASKSGNRLKNELKCLSNSKGFVQTAISEKRRGIKSKITIHESSVKKMSVAAEKSSVIVEKVKKRIAVKKSVKKAAPAPIVPPKKFSLLQSSETMKKNRPNRVLFLQLNAAVWTDFPIQVLRQNNHPKIQPSVPNMRHVHQCQVCIKLCSQQIVQVQFRLTAEFMHFVFV